MQVKAQALRDIEKLIGKYESYIRVANRERERNSDSIRAEVLSNAYSIAAKDLRKWTKAHKESFRRRKVVAVFLGGEFAYVAHDLPPAGADFWQYDTAGGPIKRALQQQLDESEMETYFTEEAK